MPSRPILIVDDNPDDVGNVERLATKCRLANPVFSVPSAEQAICYLKGQGIYSDREIYPLPVLILLDLVMPGAGGLGLLEWMQKEAERAIPVVILTGVSHLRQMRVAYQMGAHSFLIKPFEEREFLSVVQSFKGVETM